MAAIGPLNTINFENRAHQEQLKGILEILGVRELTGQDADQGIWGRVQDAIAAIKFIREFVHFMVNLKLKNYMMNKLTGG
jgi:hemerythrin superfamily protein